MASSDNAEDIIKAAQDLINQVQAQLTASDEELRRIGLDPEKVRSVGASQASAKDKDDAKAAFDADMRAVEQEVAEESARKSFGRPAPAAKPAATAPRRHRPMI